MGRKTLLLEPNYKNKYPPLGLMKLATYFRKCGDDLRFFKGNLRDLAVKLLSEEFFREVKNVTLAKYESNILQFIKTGQCIYIDTIPEFIWSNDYIVLRKYRQQYVAESYPKFDIICVTTLFTFYWKETVNTINGAKKFLKPDGKLYVGGIAATLLPKKFYEATEIKPIQGQLNKAGIFDKNSKVIIDTLPLDYSILEEIDYKYPASNSYFGYMTRGCPNRCSFCVVPRLEKKYRSYIAIKLQLEETTALFGQRKDLLLLDNNVFASKKFNKIINEIKDCGFHRGATYTPPSEYAIAIKHLRASKKENRNVRAYTNKIIKIYDSIAEKLPENEQGEFYLTREKANLLYPVYADVKSILNFDEIARPLYDKYFKHSPKVRYIDFNQGVDARHVIEEKIKKLSELNIRPLRIAFDHYSMADIYCNAVRLAAKYGIKNLSNYLLYNYLDKPDELYQRMRVNVDLCEELGVSIYSFPMKYHPIDDPKYFDNRNYIGKYWNRKFIRAVQAVLNATKGKIGRGKTFFEEAFGRNLDEFHKILWMPEAFIIHRFKYKDNLTKQWWEQFNSLNKEQDEILKNIISKNDFTNINDVTKNKKILTILKFYKIKRE
ncbi:MAG: hypothetical protein LBP59_13440 [Planctomycetaceae bacterium]|jgi:SAM-dependent methyltransferase|nr:hypothetical protein [Planctomycetaceae bacterium]